MASEAVDLKEARRRVSATVGVVADWTPDDIRWVAWHWGMFDHELRRCRDLEEDLMEMAEDRTPRWVLIVRAFREGIRWWVRQSPIFARVALSFAGLFVYAFVGGWLR